MLVAWSAPAPPADLFILSYSSADGTDTSKVTLDGSKMRSQVQGLLPSTQYTVSLITIQGDVTSEPITASLTTGELPHFTCERFLEVTQGRHTSKVGTGGKSRCRRGPVNTRRFAHSAEHHICTHLDRPNGLDGHMVLAITLVGVVCWINMLIFYHRVMRIATEPYGMNVSRERAHDKDTGIRGENQYELYRRNQEKRTSVVSVGADFPGGPRTGSWLCSLDLF